MNILKEYIQEIVHSLEERSFEEKDIPEYFYLVTSIHPRDGYKFLNDISEGVLKGVIGISGNKLIATRLGPNFSNTVFKMPGKALVDLNNLSRIMYNNPDYLVSNNFAALHRIIESESDPFVRIKSIITYANWPNLTGPLYKIFTSNEEVKQFINSKKIKNVNDIVKIIFAICKKYNINVSLTPEQIKNSIANVLSGYVDVVKFEDEWLVKNRMLKIPSNSELYLGLEKVSKENTLPLPELQKNLRGTVDGMILDTIISKNIEQKYRLKIMSPKRLQRTIIPIAGDD